MSAFEGHQSRVYEISSSAIFNKTKERFGGLSNMAAGFPVEVNGIPIRTSEALYQLCRYPHLPEVQEMIIGEKSPMTAKMKSKPFRKQSRKDWEIVKVRVMRWCLRVKLLQNKQKFEKLLCETRDLSIVEFSKRDAFWGAQPTEFETLEGMNVLGRLLMELREIVNHDEFNFDRELLPLQIDNFKILEKPIQSITKSKASCNYKLDQNHLEQMDMF